MQGRWRLPGAPRHGIGWQQELKEREERKRAAEESDRYAFPAPCEPVLEPRPAKRQREDADLIDTTSEATGTRPSGELSLLKEVNRIHGAISSGSDCMAVLALFGRTPQLQDVRTQYRRLLLLLHADKRTEGEEKAAGGKNRCDEAFRAVREAKKRAMDQLRARNPELGGEREPVFRPFYPTIEATMEQAANIVQPPSPDASSESSFERDPLFGKAPVARSIPQTSSPVDALDAAVSFNLLQAVAAANDSAAATQEAIEISDGEDDEDETPAVAAVGLDSSLTSQIMSLLGKFHTA
mmetsp:Transcript_11201/g.25521  ORF Transcript_11201/g.25521 Transcript_11201/m.25521 type:complete len:296 (-) Transcript_11201:40-927(-)